jgi:transcriptional regulator with XRE-family HTH domain
MDGFGENLRRLLGLHGLSGREAASLIGVSPQSLSEWVRGRRRPNLQMLLRVASFAEIPTDRLLHAEFGDLLEHELKDRGRFERVEAKIADHGGIVPATSVGTTGSHGARAAKRPRR